MAKAVEAIEVVEVTVTPRKFTTPMTRATTLKMVGTLGTLMIHATHCQG